MRQSVAAVAPKPIARSCIDQVPFAVRSGDVPVVSTGRLHHPRVRRPRECPPALVACGATHMTDRPRSASATAECEKRSASYHARRGRPSRKMATTASNNSPLQKPASLRANYGRFSNSITKQRSSVDSGLVRTDQRDRGKMEVEGRQDVGSRPCGSQSPPDRQRWVWCPISPARVLARALPVSAGPLLT